MRPLYLEFEAFGPFKEKQVIDFENLLDRQIFLVSGATGSGKTSIFDAITFALYNETSNKSRGIKHVKSDYSTYLNTCYVDFSFENKGEIYRVIRRPEQTVIGKKNNEIAKFHEVELYLPNGNIVTKTEEVKQEIIKIIGLDFERFSQIVMLPQGEFRKFLQSGSREKQEIFREIFLTHKYDVLSNKLKTKNGEYKKSLDMLKEIRNTYISMIKTEDPIFSEYLKSTDRDIEIILQSLTKETSDDEKEQEKTEDFLDSLRQKQKDLDLKNVKHTNEKILRNKKVEILLDDLKSQEEIFKLKENMVKQGNNALTVDTVFQQVIGRKHEQKITKAQREITLDNIKNNKVLYGKSKIEVLKNTKREKENESFTKEIEHNKVLIKHHEKLDIIAKNQERIEKEQVKRTSQIARFDNLIIRAKLKKSLDETDRTLKKLESIFTSFEGVKKQKILSLEKKHRYDYLYNTYMEGQAGVLAKKLKDKEPCPVCGSYDHPSPIKITEKIPKEKDVIVSREDFTKEDNKYSANLAELKLKISTFNLDYELKFERDRFLEIEVYYRSVFDDRERMFETFLKQEKICLEGVSDTDFINEAKFQDINYLNENMAVIEKRKIEDKATYNSYQDQKKEINKNLSEENQNPLVVKEKNKKIQLNLEKNKKENQKAKDEYDRIKNILSKDEGDLSRLKKQIAQEKISIENLEEKYSKLLLQFSFRDEIDFKNNLISSKNIEKLSAEITSYNNEKLELSKENKILLTDIKGKTYKDLVELERQNGTLELSILENQKKVNHLNSKIQNNREQKKNITDIIKKLEKEESRYIAINRLSNLASGRGGSYISFERYVLTAYFGQVISAANARFYEMTMGRFKMIHRKEKSSHGKSSGLDIDIFDRNTGRERDISSLSGGESFEASLSLALGLADVIQSWSGGVQINTLFIDEGFGSLDNQALDGAITTLNNLDDGERLIGIISHVQEVKERIPTHLEVTKSTKGSGIKLIEN